jgi:hypothetical protein
MKLGIFDPTREGKNPSDKLSFTYVSADGYESIGFSLELGGVGIETANLY